MLLLPLPLTQKVHGRWIGFLRIKLHFLCIKEVREVAHRIYAYCFSNKSWLLYHLILLHYSLSTCRMCWMLLEILFNCLTNKQTPFLNKMYRKIEAFLWKHSNPLNQHFHILFLIAPFCVSLMTMKWVLSY